MPKSRKSAKILLLPSKCEKLSLLISLLQFLYEFCRLVHGFFSVYLFQYSYRSSNYCDSYSCRSLTLLKVLAKSNGNLIAIAFKSEKERQLSIAIDERAITLEREPSKKKQRSYKKKDAKGIKSDNFTRGNREKSNIAIAILKI